MVVEGTVHMSNQAAYVFPFKGSILDMPVMDNWAQEFLSVI